MGLIFHIDDLFPDPFARVVLVPVDDVRRERRAAETVRRIRVVVEAHLQGDQAVFAQIEGLLRFLFLKVPQVDAATVFQVANLFQIEARHECVGGGPFRRGHDIVARLVPEVIGEGDVAHGVFPAAHDLKIFVEMQETARRVSLSIAEHGDDDLGA